MNRGPATRRRHKRCENPRCRVFFRPAHHYERTRFCCRQCAVDVRPRAAFVAMGRKGGQQRALNHLGVRRRALVAKLAALTTLEAWHEGRRSVKARLDNRVQSAKRAGFSEGYEAALQDMRLGRSA